jgi:hypothetical protein
MIKIHPRERRRPGVRCDRSFRDSVRLLRHTAYFHLANHILAIDNSEKFSVKLKIGKKTRNLNLRTGRIGDLFVLYEILAWATYRVSEKILEPLSPCVCV